MILWHMLLLAQFLKTVASLGLVSLVNLYGGCQTTCTCLLIHIHVQESSGTVHKSSSEGGHTLTNSIADSENGSVREPTTDNVLVKEEEKEVGVVAFSVYRSYWFAVGSLLTPLILLSLFLMQGTYYTVHLSMYM